MPNIFKTMASITVWVLFIFGLLTLLAAFGRILMAGSGASAPSVAMMSAYFGFAIASLFLSVVAMKLRKAME